MLYDVFILVLVVSASIGAVVLSFKIARSPVRRVGVIRELPSRDATHDKFTSKQKKFVEIVDSADKQLGWDRQRMDWVAAELCTAQPSLVGTRDLPHKLSEIGPLEVHKGYV